MKTTDHGMDQFPEELSAQNTFISGQNDTLLNVASTTLALLDADGKTLLVTDPYLFPDPAHGSYGTELVTLLKRTKASKIIYCAKIKRNDTLFQRVASALQGDGITLDFDSRLEECHDRFWYCPETDKCVIFGTSLNGIGRKICRVDALRDDETAVLKQYFRNAGILPQEA